MAITSNQVTCTTAATLIVPADLDGCSVVINNTGDKKVFLGAADVTSTTGFELASSGTVILEIILGPGEALYGITASGSCAVSFIASMSGGQGSR